MISYHRRHHGQLRPPPARNWPGHHSSSMHNQSTIDPHYLAYLRSQAAHLDSQNSALSGLHHVTPSITVPEQYSPHTSPVPYQEMSTSRPSTKQNPVREGSKWRHYTVKNSLEVTTFTRHGTKLTHTVGTQQLSTSSMVAFAMDL